THMHDLQKRLDFAALDQRNRVMVHSSVFGDFRGYASLQRSGKAVMAIKQDTHALALDLKRGGDKHREVARRQFGGNNLGVDVILRGDDLGHWMAPYRSVRSITTLSRLGSQVYNSLI